MPNSPGGCLCITYTLEQPDAASEPVSIEPSGKAPGEEAALAGEGAQLVPCHPLSPCAGPSAVPCVPVSEQGWTSGTCRQVQL